MTRFSDLWAKRSILLFAICLATAACTGGGASRRSTPTAPTGSAALALLPDAQRYAAIVAPIDGAIDRFGTESGALPASASVDDFLGIAGPLAGTVAEVDDALRRVQWPAVARLDIKAELVADESLKGDIAGTTDVTLILAAWRHQVLAAAGKISKTERSVEIDFGLV